MSNRSWIPALWLSLLLVAAFAVEVHAGTLCDKGSALSGRAGYRQPYAAGDPDVPGSTVPGDINTPGGRWIGTGATTTRTEGDSSASGSVWKLRLLATLWASGWKLSIWY